MKARFPAFRIPVAAPGAKVPEVRATVLTVPVPLKVPPLIVTGLFAFLPSTCSVPPVTVVAPFKLLVPVRIWVNPDWFNVSPTGVPLPFTPRVPEKVAVPLPPVSETIKPVG